MATPHHAMAQVGSASATEEKARAASSYQNECSIATERENIFCAGREQETGKFTLPTSPTFGL